MSSTYIGNIRGPQGYSVASAVIGGDDHLRLTLSSGAVLDTGVARGPQGLPGVNATPADTAVAGYISTTGTSETKTALAASIDSATADLAPMTTVAPAARTAGTIIGWCGDSITDGSASVNTSVYSYRAMTGKFLGARVSTASINGGVAGERSDQLLARMDSIISGGARFLFVMIGTNDASQGIALGVFQTNIIAIKAKADAAGLPLVFGTVPPRGSAATAENALIRVYNMWLKFWATQYEVPVADTFAALADPATGTLLAAYDSGDGTHPNVTGHQELAKFIAPVLSPMLSLPAWPVVAKGLGMTVDPLMTITTGAWGLVSGTSSTRSLVAALPGELPAGGWLRHTLNNSAGGTTVLSTVQTTFAAKGAVGETGWDTGDVLLLAMYARGSTALALNKILFLDNVTAISVPFEDFSTTSPGPILFKYTVPTRTWTGSFRLGFIIRAFAAETVTVDIGATDVFNLTRMGLASLVV